MAAAGGGREICSERICCRRARPEPWRRAARVVTVGRRRCCRHKRKADTAQQRGAPKPGMAILPARSGSGAGPRQVEFVGG